MEVYQRINDELKQRKHLSLKEEESINQGFVKVMVKPPVSTSAASSEPDQNELEPFLKKKHTMTIGIEIPSFFNDKKRKSEHEIKKEEERRPEKSSFNGNSFLKIDFGKGLFDEKLDFEPSDDMDNFKVVKKKDFDSKLKEIEIKSAVFNTISEDLFFSLD